MTHGETITRHEELYQNACEGMAQSVRNGDFSKHAVPKHVEDLRQELTQCLGLSLISEGFYERMDALLASLLEEV